MKGTTDMKIMHLLSSNSYSGAENVAIQISTAYEFKNDTFVYVSPTGPIQNKLEKENVNYYGLNKLNHKNLKRAIKDVNPDIIHAHDAKASLVSSLACGKVPVVTHIHGNHFNMRKLTSKTISMLYISRKASKIIWVSKSSLNDFHFRSNASIQNKSIILQNVIHPFLNDEEINTDIKKTDIVFVGRLNSIKNPLRALDIVEKISEQRAIKVQFIGSGELENTLRSEIENRKMNFVEVLGFKENPQHYIQTSKILLTTSLYEGLPMVALESLCSGTAVFGTKTDGLVDIIVNSKNGYLSDENEVLVKQILLYLNEISDSSISEVKKSFNEINNYQEYMETIKRIYIESLGGHEID